MKIAKKFEHFLKNTISSFLKFVLAQPAVSPSLTFKRILFLRYDVLGDMILSVPVLKAVRRAYPDSEIDVVCSQKNVIILKGVTFIDRLYVAGKNPFSLVGLILTLRKSQYDLIINLVTRPSFTFGILARLSGPQSVRIAGDQEKFSYLYNRNVDLPPKAEIHMLQRKFLVCRDILNTRISETETPWVNYDQKVKNQAKSLFERIKSDLSVNKRQPRIAAINLSAGLPRREWSLENNAHFIRHAINAYKHTIDGWVVLTNPAEPDRTLNLLQMVDSPKVTSLSAQPDFRIIMELLIHIFVLITPDTSIAHAASAMGTPVLVLTIGENIKIWDPVGVPHVIVLSDDLYSLKELKVKKVISGFDKLHQSINVN